MFLCLKCSTQLPDDAIACYHCGTVTDPTFVQPTTRQFPTGAKVGIGVGTVAVIVVLTAIAVAALSILVFAALSRDDNVTRNQTPSPTERETPQPRPQRTPRMEAPPAETPAPRLVEPKPEITEIFNSTLQTPPGINQFAYKLLNIDRDGILEGRLEGEGGIRGEYTALILDDEQYVGFRNGKSVPTIFNSNQKLTVTEIRSVRVKAGPHYLIILNPSGWTGRQVTGRITLK